MAEMMVERVGAAIIAAIGKGLLHGSDGFYESSGGDIGFKLDDVARAAIAAMREPTPEMLEAGATAMWDGVEYSLEPGEGIDAMNADVVWEDMIDDALASPQSPGNGRVRE